MLANYFCNFDAMKGAHSTPKHLPLDRVESGGVANLRLVDPLSYLP